ncbi:MAG: hypothetical protein ACKOJE_01215, partial [Bacteroidota bacterium]
ARAGLRERFCPAGHRLLVHVSNFRRVKRIDRVLEWYRAIDLLNNTEILDQFRNAALRRAAQYNITQILPHYEGLYAGALGRGTREIS